MRDHDDDRACRIGGHPHRDNADVCGPHLAQIREQLAGVVAMTRRLAYHLAPGSPPAGDKLSRPGRVGSPTAARLDVLSLVGPGVTEIRRDARSLVPQVRRWSTLHEYTIRIGDGPDQRRTVRTWHSELVAGDVTRRPCRCGDVHDEDFDGRPRRQPRLVLADDQVGVIPPAEWCDVWVRRWRLLLGHHQAPARIRIALRADVDRAQRLADAAVRQARLLAAGHAGTMPAVAAYLAVKQGYAHMLAEARRRVNAALLGVRDDGEAHQARVAAALAGDRVPRLEHDAVAAEWIVRYGGAVTAAYTEVDAGYLAEWLPLVGDLDDGDVGAFAAELRSLHAELEHTLGETRDEQWLGRCPAELLVDGEPTGPLCGAGLWHDPYRTRVECPRCHTATPEKDWVRLAARIRHAWPIDPRRRYNDGDRKAAELNVDRLPRCRGCERTMAVQWREVTARGDRGPMWRPVRLACPQGCLAGGTMVAA